MLPLPTIFAQGGMWELQRAYLADSDLMQERFDRWSKLYSGVIQRFEQYQIPAIVLHRDTPKAAVCKVFEKVNMGGVKLTVFELLTAVFAADNFKLRDDWDERRRRFRSDQSVGRLRQRIESTDFLQAVTLLSTYDRTRKKAPSGDAGGSVTCKKEDVLALPIIEYQKWAPIAEKGFLQAARLLHRNKLFTWRDLPYRTQLTPLASVLAILDDRTEDPAVRDKLMRWFWCGVFGELYSGAIESRFARDVMEVSNWIVAGGDEPSTIEEAHFAPSRLRSMRTRLSAAYKGVNALLLGDGAQDFRTSDELEMAVYFDDKIDIHHIFPQKWCRDHGVDASVADSIVNKTPLAARTNRIISSKAPSEYLPAIQRYRGANISDAQLDAILEKHAIDPGTLRADDFEGFTAARSQALLQRIWSAMGKEWIDAPEPDSEPDLDVLDEEEEEEAEYGD